MATGVPRPAFTAELLADLHADNLTPEQRAQLWPEVSRSPEALRFLRSLDAVSAELRALGCDERIIHPMPADVAARLTQFVDELDPPENTGDAATEDGSAAGSAAQHATTSAAIHSLPAPQDTTIHPLATAPPSAATAPPSESIGESDRQPRALESPLAQPVALSERQRRSRIRWLAAAAAAILAVTAVGGVASMLRSGDDPAPTAQPSTAPGQLGDELTATVALSALGRHTATGGLANPAALDRCVQANGLHRTVLGSTDITFHGGNAVLILLTGPRPPTVTALVVGTGCTTGDPQRRALHDIG